MKALLWVKKYALWVLGGLVAVAGVLFAVKYEKEKVGSLKRRVEIAKAKGSIAVSKEKKEEAVRQEKERALADRVLVESIKKREQEVAAVREKAQESTSGEAAKRLNEIYRKR